MVIAVVVVVTLYGVSVSLVCLTNKWSQNEGYGVNVVYGPEEKCVKLAYLDIKIALLYF